MVSNRSMFYGSVFESTYKRLKEIERYQAASPILLPDVAQCTMQNCSWNGSTSRDFRYHVKTRHATEYLQLKQQETPMEVSTIDQEAIQSEEDHRPDSFEASDILENDQLTIDSESDDNVEPNSDFDGDPFEETFRVLDVHVSSSNSSFLNSIKSDFTPELQSIIYSRFNKIVELRWGEAIPESTYSRIVEEILSESVNGFENKFNDAEWNLHERVLRFASSLHLQQEYLKSQCSIIEPEEISITSDFTIQYISLVKVATSALINSSLVNEIIREQNSDYNINIYSNELACDYNRWRRIRGKLRIELYFDEFSIVNPIGASKHEHKYLVAYCTFSNIPIKARLKRDDVYLLLIANHKHLDSATLDKVLHPLYLDLKQLCHHGIQVENQSTGEAVTIPCALSSIVADNLERYHLAGSSMNFNLYYHCQMCGASHTESQDLCIDKRLLGSQDDVTKYWDLSRLANGTLLPANEFSLLRTFKFAMQELDIHPWNVFPPDVMHDFSEGMIPKLTDFILTHLYQSYRCTKAEMVNMVNECQFYDAKFNISSRQKGGGFKIGGDAVQRSELFIRLHLLFIRNFENVTSRRPFQLYYVFFQVCKICFQESISEDEIQVLSDSITDVYRLIKEIDPSYKIFPKLHQLCHYPQLIRFFGSPVLFSTLRYERKHAYFKRWSRIMGNHRNPAFSLAMRHQYYFVLTSKATEYPTIKFDFKLPQLLNNETFTEHLFEVQPTSTIRLLSSQYPFKLKKGVVRRIGQSDFWIEAQKFWKQYGSNTIFVQGSIYRKLNQFLSLLPRLTVRYSSRYISMSYLYHVNDFIDTIDGQKVLVSGLF